MTVKTKDGDTIKADVINVIPPMQAGKIVTASGLADDKGWVRGLKCIRMELGEPDEKGRRRPIEVPGSEFEMACDSVIMALGTSPNPLLRKATPDLEYSDRGGIVVQDDTVTTMKDGVFAGGDAVTGAATVIKAMGAGKKAAAAIDAYIRSK